MAKNYNPEIVDAVRNCLDNDDWNYRFDNENGVFRFGLDIKGKIRKVQYVIVISEIDYYVYACSPISADQDDAEQMRQMSEFICRANYGLKDGNFELDFRSGEIRYKCFVNCNGVTPTNEMVKSSILCPAAMFTRYGKGIVQILFNDMSAVDAIEMCEGAQKHPAGHRSDEEESSARLMDTLRRLQNGQENS